MFQFHSFCKNDHLGYILIRVCLIGKFRVICLRGRKKAQTKYFIVSIINAKKSIQTKLGFSKLYIHKYLFLTITFNFFSHKAFHDLIYYIQFFFIPLKKCLLDLQLVLLKQRLEHHAPKENKVKRKVPYKLLKIVCYKVLKSLQH